MKGYYTVKEVAERLNLSTARIRQLIIEKKLTAEKQGRDNFIADSELKRFEQLERKAGNPHKN